MQYSALRFVGTTEVEWQNVQVIFGIYIVLVTNIILLMLFLSSEL